jgi:hypothetical protein
VLPGDGSAALRGIVEVPSNANLGELRAVIASELDGLPERFQFVRYHGDSHDTVAVEDEGMPASHCLRDGCVTICVSPAVSPATSAGASPHIHSANFDAAPRAEAAPRQSLKQKAKAAAAERLAQAPAEHLSPPGARKRKTSKERHRMADQTLAQLLDSTSLTALQDMKI